MIPLIFPLLIGFAFDMLSGIKFGFYFIPALVMSMTFHFLPFVFIWLNMAIAYLAAFAVFFAWSYFLAGSNTPSSGFILHISIYLIMIGVVLYIIHAIQKK